jgi:hypothetical protein
LNKLSFSGIEIDRQRLQEEYLILVGLELITFASN